VTVHQTTPSATAAGTHRLHASNVDGAHDHVGHTLHDGPGPRLQVCARGVRHQVRVAQQRLDLRSRKR
jgi:hypothetical protein